MSENITIDLEGLSKEEREQLLGLVEKAKKPEKIWKPKCGEWYWFIGSDGQVDNCEWANDHIDRGRYSMGNCFRTKEEAEFTREKQIIKTELQRYADEHNDPDKEEWNKTNGHYEIVYNYRLGRLDFSELRSCSSTDAIYFTSEELAKKAVETVGRERILKYMFSIDCEEDD